MLLRYIFVVFALFVITVSSGNYNPEIVAKSAYPQSNGTMIMITFILAIPITFLLQGFLYFVNKTRHAYGSCKVRYIIYTLAYVIAVVGFIPLLYAL